MKRTAVFLFFVVLLGEPLSFQAEENQRSLLLKALAEKNPQVKYELLEGFFRKYGFDETKTSRILTLQLAYTAYQLKRFEDVIQFGEKALTYQDIGDNNRIQLYLFLGNSYWVLRQNLEKAYDYADLVIQLGKRFREALKEDDKKTLDIGFIAPAYRLQIKIINLRPMDEKNIRKALQKAVEAYDIDSSERSADLVFGFSLRMVKLGFLDEAIAACERICGEKNSDPEYSWRLAVWYQKKGDKDKSIHYLKESYNLRQDAKVAYNLGRMLQKKDIETAIGYLAEAVVLKDETYSSKAEVLLKHLFYNIKAKGKKISEQDMEFQLILKKARIQVGLAESESS